MICRNCGAGLEADRIDASLRVVTCSHCGSLHNIPTSRLDHQSTDVTAGQRKKPEHAKPENIEVTLPSRFKVQRTESSMEVTWAVGRLFHGVVLVIIAVGVIHAALTSEVPFLLILSAGLFYYAAVRIFNKHRIRVDSGRLQVTQGPLPWLGVRNLDAKDVKQLFATERQTRVDSGSGGSGNNRQPRVRKYYRLSANTHSNGSVTILSGISDPLQVLWLEQEIERVLDIQDEQVSGEYRS